MNGNIVTTTEIYKQDGFYYDDYYRDVLDLNFPHLISDYKSYFIPFNQTEPTQLWLLN